MVSMAMLADQAEAQQPTLVLVEQELQIKVMLVVIVEAVTDQLAAEAAAAVVLVQLELAVTEALVTAE